MGRIYNQIVFTKLGQWPTAYIIRYKQYTDEIRRRETDLLMSVLDKILLEMEKLNEAGSVTSQSDDNVNCPRLDNEPTSGLIKETAAGRIVGADSSDKLPLSMDRAVQAADVR